MTLDQHILRDPSICGGEPVIRGTRVPLRTILASLADGDSVEQIVAQSAARFLVTQDLDFSDVRKFAPGTHAGIMLVRLRLAPRRAPIARVRTAPRVSFHFA